MRGRPLKLESLLLVVNFREHCFSSSNPAQMLSTESVAFLL
nr:MAG TPA: hypothetical protein [Caudoviricetes sp.]